MPVQPTVSSFLLQPYRHVDSFGYELPQGLVGVWLSCGAEFQLEYDIETDEGADALLFWWFASGRREFRGVSKQLDRHLARALHFDYLAEMAKQQEPVLTPLLSILYRHRGDLREAFDLKSPLGLMSLWHWWISDGHHQILDGADWLINEQVEQLHRCQLANVYHPIAPTLLMRIASFNSNSKQMGHENTRHEVASWTSFFSVIAPAFGLPNSGLPVLENRLPKELFRLASGQQLPAELAFVFAIRHDLHPIFDVQTAKGTADFVCWWLTDGSQTLGPLGALIDRVLLQDLHWAHLPEILESGICTPTPFLYAIRDGRADISKAFDCLTSESKSQLWHWLFTSAAFPTIDVSLPSTLSKIRMASNKFGNVSRFELPEKTFIPDTLVFVWSLRTDIQVELNINTIKGASGFVLWWLSSEHPDIGPFSEVISHDLLKVLHWDALPTILASPKLILTPLFKVLIDGRTDLKMAFADASSSPLEMWRWWLDNWKHHFPQAQAGLNETLEHLAQHSLSLEAEDEAHKSVHKTLPSELIFLHAIHPDFQDVFDITTEIGSIRFIFWWFSDGFLTYGDSGLEICRRLMQTLHWSHLPAIIATGEPKLTPLLAMVQQYRPDLAISTDGLSGNDAKVWHWWSSHGLAEFPGCAVHVDALNQYTAEASQQPLASRFKTSLPYGLVLPNELLFIYDIRFDIHDTFNLKTEDGALAFLMWWLTSDTRQMGELAQWVNQALMRDLHWSHLDDMIEANHLKLTPLLAFIKESRSDLSKRFAGGTEAEIHAFWQWWMTGGQLNYPGTIDHSAGVNARPKIVRYRSRYAALQTVFPNIVPIILMFRPDVRDVISDFESSSGTDETVIWWLNYGRHEYKTVAQGVTEMLIQRMHLDYIAETSSNDNEAEPTPFMKLVFRFRLNLGLSFDKPSWTNEDVWTWWHQKARISLFGEKKAQSVFLAAQKARRGELSSSKGSTTVKRYASSSSIDNDDLPVEQLKGRRVSLVGYPRGEFGLGEDIRLLRASLQSSGVDPAIIRAPWKIAARQNIDEVSIDGDLATFESDVMFYVMPAFDTVTLLNKIGPRAFVARRKIGFWQWELDRFPSSALIAMNLVDEIWCHSEHSARAFRAATDRPVYKVPLPVCVPEPIKVPRSRFNLSDDDFVVFTSFDGASSIARKNPLGTILAFQEAFPEKHDNARLIVKAMNTENDSLWRECLRKAKSDRRIIIIDEVMDRSVYYELLRNCDAVISLHRAEGFGRLMAEASALGIPVIASRYSGNLDFMTDRNSWLVDGDLIPVLAGDYAFHRGQMWIEPNISSAAQALRECANDPAASARRAKLSRQNIEQNYNLNVCGRVYSELLNGNVSQRESTVQ